MAGSLTVRRSAPGVALGLGGLIAVAAGLPLVGLLAVVALLALTPWASSLAVRGMAGLLLVLAAGAVAVQLTGVRWGAGPLLIPVGALTLLQLIVAKARRGISLVPELGVADGVALLGGGLLAGLLGAPYLGRSADDVLLDLARASDSVNHVLAVANLLSEQGSAWTNPGSLSPNGSIPVMAGYPLAFHAVVAGALSLGGVGPTRDIVVGYAWAAVLALGLCAATLGWVAVRVAATLGSAGRASNRALWSALGFVGCALLAGSFVAPFQLGHAPFIVAATAGLIASWLALELLASPDALLGPSWADVQLNPGSHRHAPAHASSHPLGPRWAALAVLAVGLIALFGAYPPLAAGLLPAAGAWVWTWGPGPLRAWTRPLVAVALALVAGAGVWRWRDRIEQMMVAEGENSTPFLASIVLTIITATGAWLVWRRGWGIAPARAMAASGGFCLAALALAIGGASHGLSAADNYYSTKLAEAAWLGALPVLCALLAAVVVPATERRRRWSRVAICGMVMLGLAVLLSALPVGRSDGPLVGPSLLAQRLLEARRASGQVQLVLAARLAGPGTGDASAMLDPLGWLHPVGHEAAPALQLRREAISAAIWLATLRGVRTEDGDVVAACFDAHGGIESLPCVQAWLSVDPERRITLVVRQGPTADAVRTWARSRSDQVRIVTLPARIG